ncbi:MAG: PEP-CTERM sorting domain-containing protein [Verrucomicrobiota bacterium]
MLQRKFKFAAALTASGLLLGLANSQAASFLINSSSDLFDPSFRGDSNTTWLGWDVFGVPSEGETDPPINNNTPDIGTDSGTFATSNGEDHLSSSGNYYSGFGSVAETVTFGTSGTPGSGFTTIILQGKTLFGDFATEFTFSDLGGATPTVVFGTNADSEGQFFAKYEITGNAAEYTVNLASFPGSFVSLDQFEVDTVWSATGFASDTAAVPEPSSIALVGLGGFLALVRRKRK